MNLQQKVEGIVRQSDAEFGVAIKHLETGEEVNIAADQLFQMASCFKIPILVTLFNQEQEGRVNLQERILMQVNDRVPGSGVLKELDEEVELSVKDLATLMIIVSDNSATDKVLSIVGVDRVQQHMQELGLQHMSVRHSCWDLLSLCVGITPQRNKEKSFEDVSRRLKEGKFDTDVVTSREIKENNFSTAHDMNALLEKIACRELSYATDVNNILLKQHLRNRIPRLLPPNTAVANKTGTIGSVVNDVGIVYLPENGGAFIITVFSQGHASTEEGEMMIARISQVVYQHFMR